MYSKVFKRVFDILISFFLLLILSPLLLFVSVILIFQNKGKIFFLQSRPGLNGKAFNIIKFKSMLDLVDKNGLLLSDNLRITFFGNFIRKFSIDELPQLLNVLRGDMSLVGPRPLLFKYFPLYNAQQFRRHLVKPGITGLAQVMGRNSISWTKKFEYDVYYVDNISFKLDVIILIRTILKVIKREGVNQSVERPMIPFDGTN